METTAPEHLKILIAEDDKGHFALVKKNLWRTCVDAEIMHFSNGSHLLEFFHQQDADPGTFEKGCYLILLDIKMPGRDGLDVLAQLRSTPKLNNIPIVMLTTTNDPQEIERSYALGCSFYIVKPSDYNKFMDTIEHLGKFLCLSSNRFPVIDPDATNT